MSTLYMRPTFVGHHVTIVEVQGDLTDRSGQKLASWLEKAARRRPGLRIHLDVHRLRMATAAGCRRLAQVSRELREQGTELIVQDVPAALASPLHEVSAA